MLVYPRVYFRALVVGGVIVVVWPCTFLQKWGSETSRAAENELRCQSEYGVPLGKRNVHFYDCLKQSWKWKTLVLFQFHAMPLRSFISQHIPYFVVFNCMAQHVWSQTGRLTGDQTWRLFSGWWFGTFVFFPYIGNNQNNHPNWRTHIFQRGRSNTNQFSIFSHIRNAIFVEVFPTNHFCHRQRSQVDKNNKKKFTQAQSKGAHTDCIGWFQSWVPPNLMVESYMLEFSLVWTTPAWPVIYLKMSICQNILNLTCTKQSWP